MKCLRIILTQSSANYRREETDTNKMTYPLPPFSTVIGALHKACGYTETKNMNLSIQGSYESMGREPYRDCLFFNSTLDDRGILVKMSNPDDLCGAYTRVASAKKSQGNSFLDGKTILVENESLLKEYRELKMMSKEIDEFKKTRLKPILDRLKAQRKKYANIKKSFDKKSDEFLKYSNKEKRIKKFEDEINGRFKAYEYNNYTMPMSKFRTMNTSLKYYEVLYGIRLIIHITADDEVLNDIYNNIYNLKAIGRSEDFVNVESAEFVQLLNKIDNDVESENSAYLNISAVRNNRIFTKSFGERNIIGTKYVLNKFYEVINNKRVFKDKKSVIYASKYAIEECCPEENIYYDGKYIVNLI